MLDAQRERESKAILVLLIGTIVSSWTWIVFSIVQIIQIVTQLRLLETYTERNKEDPFPISRKSIEKKKPAH